MSNIFDHDNCDCDCDFNFDPADLADPDNSIYRGLRADYPGYFNHSQQQPQQSPKGYYDWKPLPFKKLVKGLVIFILAGFLSSILGVAVSLLIHLF